MLRLLIDHDLDHVILRGLLQRIPDLDAVAAFEAGLSDAPDPELPAWAAKEGRVICYAGFVLQSPNIVHRNISTGEDVQPAGKFCG